jgi:hypothetical protein
LFGGFSSDFYTAYDEAFPLDAGYPNALMHLRDDNGKGTMPQSNAAFRPHTSKLN